MKRYRVIRTSTKKVTGRVCANNYPEAYEKAKSAGLLDRSYLSLEINATSLGDEI